MTRAQQVTLLKLTDRLMARARRNERSFWLCMRVAYLASLVNQGSRWRAFVMSLEVAAAQIRVWWMVRYG
jgi:hypothetical protein